MGPREAGPEDNDLQLYLAGLFCGWKEPYIKQKYAKSLFHPSTSSLVSCPVQF